VDAHGEALPATAARESQADLETIFTAHYARISRVLARVVRDRARAEELAVDVFLRWSRHPGARGDGAAGWLYRTAVRMGLDELRREARRSRYERLIGGLGRSPATPEEVRAASEDQRRVRVVLAALRARDAELLVLRGQGLRYEDLAAAFGLNPASIGTLIARAQRAFRKEFVRRYGDQ
jgi:RNA polymerase sigma-70 factor (ECF subfamily)